MELLFLSVFKHHKNWGFVCRKFWHPQVEPLASYRPPLSRRRSSARLTAGLRCARSTGGHNWSVPERRPSDSGIPRQNLGTEFFGERVIFHQSQGLFKVTHGFKNNWVVSQLIRILWCFLTSSVLWSPFLDGDTRRYPQWISSSCSPPLGQDGSNFNHCIRSSSIDTSIIYFSNIYQFWCLH